ncbi:hypothetical protein U3A55_02445 [Salarchaeum sp. III]|uniref:hypothetical protein n=1 Tax=Salarchaeum sp. III TaxID=3107927 RepID=UPI002ED7E490
MFGRKQESIFETDDKLIIFDHDQKTSDIKPVTNITEDSVICAGHHKVPYTDCEVTNSTTGRNFFYRAPSESITETKKLAQLERSTVLKQITGYQPKEEEKSDSNKLFMWGVIFLLIVGLLFFS